MGHIYISDMHLVMHLLESCNIVMNKGCNAILTCTYTSIWCVYKAVPRHAVVATCLCTTNWEEARVLCNGCCLYIHMYIQCIYRCLCCVVWSMGLCTYIVDMSI